MAKFEWKAGPSKKLVQTTKNIEAYVAKANKSIKKGEIIVAVEGTDITVELPCGTTGEGKIGNCGFVITNVSNYKQTKLKQADLFGRFKQSFKK